MLYVVGAASIMHGVVPTALLEAKVEKSDWEVFFIDMCVMAWWTTTMFGLVIGWAAVTVNVKFALQRRLWPEWSDKPAEEATE